MKKGFRAGREKKLLEHFTPYFDELGPTAEVSILGGTGYVTKDPENIEAILSTRFEGRLFGHSFWSAAIQALESNHDITPDFHLGPRNIAMDAMIGEGIFTQDGPAWKRSREVLRRQFARMQYQNLEGFREHLENLIRNLRSSSGVTDIQPLFYRLTLNTTIAMILGQPVESFEHEIGDLFSRSFNKASLITATRVRLGDLYWLYAPRGFFAACATVKKYTGQFVKEALQRESESTEKSDKAAFITELYLDSHDQRLVRDQVINVLIAGRDTTAATMSYAL